MIIFFALRKCNTLTSHITVLVPAHLLPLTYFDALSDNKGTLDESDRFLTSPSEFVGEVFGNLSSFSHIVLFESEERHVLHLLLRNSFLEVISHDGLGIIFFNKITLWFSTHMGTAFQCSLLFGKQYLLDCY